MSSNFKYSNVGNFQPVESMNQSVRQEQYAFNGRIFIPPNPTPNQNEMFGNPLLTGEYDNRNDNNGLVQFPPNKSVKPYELYKDSSKMQDTNVSIISNIVVPNALSRTFFSNDNVERIQLQIIDNVFNQSQQKISKQSYQEIQIIMKSMYLQYGRNLPTDIEGQVYTLNKYVVDECVRIILPNVSQYSKYLVDIASPLPVFPLPASTSTNKSNGVSGFSSVIPSTNTYVNNL